MRGTITRGEDGFPTNRVRATKTVFVPSISYPGFDASGKATTAFAGVVAATVERTAIIERGRISHDPNPAPTPPSAPTAPATAPAPPVAICSPNTPGCSPVPTTVPGRAMIPIRRSLVVAGRLVTVSDRGVKVSDLGAYGDQGFVTFVR